MVRFVLYGIHNLIVRKNNIFMFYFVLLQMAGINVASLSFYFDLLRYSSDGFLYFRFLFCFLLSQATVSDEGSLLFNIDTMCRT